MRTNARGFMARLRTDTAGNTLAMAAAALIPLIAAVGGAVDISRYYMANARLQAACDAGALAARKSMAENDFRRQDRRLGLRFFDQNYPDGTFGLENLSRNFSADSGGTVIGTATGALPTTLMQIFNYGELDLSVTCSAEVNISNTDIVFVFDTTGSMNCPDDGSFCPGGDNGGIEAPNARMVGARRAVLRFYDTVESATSSAAQVRYGFVPYASNVNVGFSIPRAHMADEMSAATIGSSFPTRQANFQVRTSETRVSTRLDSVSNQSGETFLRRERDDTGQRGVNTRRDCDRLAANGTFGSDAEFVPGSLENVRVISETTVGDLRTQVISGEANFTRSEPVAVFSRRARPRCRIDLRHYVFDANFRATIVSRVTTERSFRNWLYARDGISYDVSDLYDDNRIELPVGRNGSDELIRWDGCILEAATVTTDNFRPLPAQAYDLDINHIPTSERERWKPALQELFYRHRDTNNNNTRSDVIKSNDDFHPRFTCPREAFRLQEIERANLRDYVNSLQGESFTYHDIGMIWGARFISPRGIFASDNATAPNGDAIGRHIVFMTDGALVTNRLILTPYGIDWWDQHISGNGRVDTASERHSARLQAVCRQARQENISVWVVAFGTQLTQNLIDCATPGRAFHADDSADLEDQFAEIAQQIAALRLTN